MVGTWSEGGNKALFKYKSELAMNSSEIKGCASLRVSPVLKPGAETNSIPLSQLWRQGLGLAYRDARVAKDELWTRQIMNRWKFVGSLRRYSFPIERSQ